jgi:hypothetical protein
MNIDRLKEAFCADSTLCLAHVRDGVAMWGVQRHERFPQGMLRYACSMFAKSFYIYGFVRALV